MATSKITQIQGLEKHYFINSQNDESVSGFGEWGLVIKIAPAHNHHYDNKHY
jgi:hypothetical protein